MISVAPHPLLDVRAFYTHFPKALGGYSDAELSTIRLFFGPSKKVPISFVETKGLIRDLLRTNGFSPSGRNKPAHEYLDKAIEKGWFTESSGINAAVDVCNVISLHSKLPISVLDKSKISPPLLLRCCDAGTVYPFNPSGQLLKAGGLLSLHDAKGPTASPVKDAQRSKTDKNTTDTLSIIWSHRALNEHTDNTEAWYKALLIELGAQIHPIQLIMQ
jgi:hypothetical protein